MSAACLKVALLFVACSAGTVLARAQIGMASGMGGRETNQPSATVQGVVLDSLTRQPIARALVDGSFDAVLTDQQGRFQLTLPSGYANLQVRRPGYNAPNGGMRYIRVSATMPPLTLYLTPSGSITGHVLLSGDDDPAMIRFAAYRKSVMNGHEMWMQSGFTMPDSDGTFHFLQLDAPGSFIVCSTPSSEPGPQRGYVLGFPQRCYPGETDFGSVTPLELAAGQHAQIDVNLEMQPFYPIAITVPNAQNVPGIQIYDRGGLMIPALSMSTHTPGKTEFRLPNGSYYAEARAWNPKQMFGRVDFTVANGPLQLTMPLLPLTPVPVVIHKEFSQDASKGRQMLVQMGTQGDPNPGMQLTLQPAGKVSNGGFGGGLRHVSGGGPEAFEMDAVPGRWRAQVFAYGGYVSSMTSGGVDLLHDPLVIGSGSSVQPIYVTLRDDGGQIKCSVTEADSAEDPASGMSVYQVVAIAQFPDAIPIHSAVGQNGLPATLSDLPPGDYRVAAFDTMPILDLDDPDQLGRVMTNAQTVHVDADGTASVQLSLIRVGDTGAAQ